jgi:5-methylcytosine-specific restriction endonuclease McrA
MACYSAWRHDNIWQRIAIECANCGKPLDVCPNHFRYRKQAFCDRACFYEWQQKNREYWAPVARVTLTCEQCGTSFDVTPGQAEKGRRFCSRACFTAWKSANWRGVKAPGWNGGPVVSRCDACGEPFEARPSSGQRFCSRTCYGRWQSEHLTGKEALRWTGGKVTVYCATCGKPLERIRSEIENRTRRFFCNQECHGRWQAENQVGEAHPNWKGGELYYYGPNWEAQRQRARKRDKNRCQHCGKKQRGNRRAMDVHHIKPFREFGYIPGENENYRQANRLSNLICLCSSCHRKADAGSIAVQPYLIPEPVGV